MVDCRKCFGGGFMDQNDSQLSSSCRTLKAGRAFFDSIHLFLSVVVGLFLISLCGVCGFCPPKWAGYLRPLSLPPFFICGSYSERLSNARHVVAAFSVVHGLGPCGFRWIRLSFFEEVLRGHKRYFSVWGVSRKISERKTEKFLVCSEIFFVF